MSLYPGYPFYAIGVQSKIIVYFIKPSCGFTIESLSKENQDLKKRYTKAHHETGYFCQSWSMKRFTKITNSDRIKKLERKRKLLSL